MTRNLRRYPDYCGRRAGLDVVRPHLSRSSLTKGTAWSTVRLIGSLVFFTDGIMGIEILRDETLCLNLGPMPPETLT